MWKQKLRKAIEVVRAVPGDRYFQNVFPAPRITPRGCAAYHIREAMCSKKGIGAVAWEIMAGAPLTKITAVDRLFHLLTLCDADGRHVSHGAAARDLMVQELESVLRD